MVEKRALAGLETPWNIKDVTPLQVRPAPSHRADGETGQSGQVAARAAEEVRRAETGSAWTTVTVARAPGSDMDHSLMRLMKRILVEVRPR